MKPTCGPHPPTHGRSRRRSLLAAVAVLVVAACGGGGDDGGGAGGDGGGGDGDDGDGVLGQGRWENVVAGPVEEDGEPVQGGSITVALDAEADTYLPSGFRCCQSSFNVAYAVFDPLVTQDAEGNIRPYLAASVEPNAEFTTWTVELRPDVRFHDGTPLNAEAMRRIFDDYLMAEGSITAALGDFVDRLEVVDDLTVRFVLSEPHAQFTDWLQLPLGWPFSPDAADQLGQSFGDQPVGTGPFRFVSWQRDGDLVVERNEDYWQEGLPHLDQITFRSIPDETTQAAALASGDVDAVQSDRLSQFPAALADIDGVTVVLGQGNRTGAVLFNTSSAPLDDVRIRRSLVHATDDAALLEVAAGEAAELSELRTQFFPASSPFHSDAVAEAWPGYDPDEAAALYQEYVDDPGRSDGRAPGEPVEITVQSSNLPADTELASAYQSFYEEIGYEVTVDVVEESNMSANRLVGEFQIQLAHLGGNRSPLGELLFYLGTPDLITNYSDFSSETIDEVIAGLRTLRDPAEQAPLIETLGLHLAEQVPWEWTSSFQTLIAATDQVHGLRSWTFPDGTLGDAVTPSITFWSQAWLEE